MAFLNYEDAHGHLPPAAVCGPDGTPLLSWRVLLLPYLEQQELYDQLRLDEPWDSGHNRRFIDRMPSTFKAPYTRYVDVPAGHTVLKVFVGPGTALGGGACERCGDSFPDGRERTLLYVEAGDPVPWMKPADVPFDPNRPSVLKGLFRDGYRSGTADGAGYKFIRHGVPWPRLRAAITRDSGETDTSPWE